MSIKHVKTSSHTPGRVVNHRPRDTASVSCVGGNRKKAPLPSPPSQSQTRRNQEGRLRVTYRFYGRGEER